MSRSLLRILAAFATALVLLGACGGDDEGAESPSAETSEPDDADSTDDESDDESDDEGVDDTTETTGNEGDETESTGVDPSDLPSPLTIDDFCGVFEAFNAIEDPYVTAGEDPDARAAAFRDAFTMAAALFERGAQLAPDEVAADMALVSEAFGDLTDIMAEYEWDEMAVEEASGVDLTIEERMQVLDSEEFATAEENVEAFVLTDCGIELR